MKNQNYKDLDYELTIPQKIVAIDSLIEDCQLELEKTNKAIQFNNKFLKINSLMTATTLAVCSVIDSPYEKIILNFVAIKVILNIIAVCSNMYLRKSIYDIYFSSEALKSLSNYYKRLQLYQNSTPLIEEAVEDEK